jgi:hypothetical protein
LHCNFPQDFSRQILVIAYPNPAIALVGAKNNLSPVSNLRGLVRHVLAVAIHQSIAHRVERGVVHEELLLPSNRTSLHFLLVGWILILVPKFILVLALPRRLPEGLLL